MGRCSWTRCRICRRQRRRSCFARSRTSPSSVSAGRHEPCRHPDHRRLEQVALDARGGRQFRLDLFYRLNGVDVHVPALRERRDDIELARYFLERHRTLRPLSLSAAAPDALLAYDWPGNVRELERVIERAVALAGGPFLELDDLPPRCSAATPTCCCRRSASNRACVRGAAATRGSCSSAVATTSDKPVVSLASRITRSTRICAFARASIRNPRRRNPSTRERRRDDASGRSPATLRQTTGNQSSCRSGTLTTSPPHRVRVAVAGRTNKCGSR